VTRSAEARNARPDAGTHRVGDFARLRDGDAEATGEQVGQIGAVPALRVAWKTTAPDRLPLLWLRSVGAKAPRATGLVKCARCRDRLREAPPGRSRRCARPFARPHSRKLLRAVVARLLVRKLAGSACANVPAPLTLRVQGEINLRATKARLESEGGSDEGLSNAWRDGNRRLWLARHERLCERGGSVPRTRRDDDRYLRVR